MSISIANEKSHFWKITHSSFIHVDKKYSRFASKKRIILFNFYGWKNQSSTLFVNDFRVYINLSSSLEKKVKFFARNWSVMCRWYHRIKLREKNEQINKPKWNIRSTFFLLNYLLNVVNRIILHLFQFRYPHIDCCCWFFIFFYWN